MKKISLLFSTLFTIFVFQLIFSGAIVEAEENQENSTQVIDGTSLSKSELDSIRKNEDYAIELTYEQALERAAEVSGKSVEALKEPEGLYDLKTAAACGWMETATTLTVKSYNPKLIVIVEACRDGSFGWITSKKPLLQEFQAGSKKFDGTIKVDLDNTGFTYVVNGTFYNHGTVTHTGTTGANAVFTATYTVSSASNYYGNIYTGIKYKRIIN